LQHDVADGVTARVIDFLEVVEINTDHSNGRAAASRLPQVGAQTRLERPTIHAARERIATDLLGEPRVHRLKAAREQRELVGPTLRTQLRERRDFAALDDFAVHPQRIHALPKTSEGVNENGAD